jgi:gliding motility-associated protein GldM
MAGYKETPRQKMIAMMYLVLTALLALNVSKEVLDAFVVVNESVALTNENFSEKLNELYNTFDKQYQINQNKVKPFRDKAIEAKRLSTEMINYIDDVKWRLIEVTERIPYDSAKLIPVKKLAKLDDFTTTTNFFMAGSTDGTKGEVIKLKNKIINYREKILSLVDEKNRGQIKIGLQTDGNYLDRDGNHLNWVQYNFYHTVLAANLAILNKMTTEVYNAEFDVVNYLLASIDAADFKYDTVAARVLPKRDYVFIGDRYEAEILVAAYDTRQDPEVYILEGADRMTDEQISRARPIAGQKGVVKVNFPAQTEGLKRFAGIFRLTTGTGEVNSYPFSANYVVARPTTTISATKMNVFYAGVDNPISVSSPGVPLENLEVTISVGHIRKDNKPGNYIVTVPVDKKEAIVTVSARIDGQLKKQGDNSYRIKRVPDPTALIAGYKEGAINRNVLAQVNAIEASMPQDFEFDLNFRITSFKMTTLSGSIVTDFKSNSNRLTDEMKNRIRNANRGDRVWFEDIIARGPDGTDRPLNPISLTLN